MNVGRKGTTDHLGGLVLEVTGCITTRSPDVRLVRRMRNGALIGSSRQFQRDTLLVSTGGWVAAVTGDDRGGNDRDEYDE